MPPGIKKPPEKCRGYRYRKKTLAKPLPVRKLAGCCKIDVDILNALLLSKIEKPF